MIKNANYSKRESTMPESRSKYSQTAVARRKGNIRNILLGLLIGLAIIFVILAGRYVYGKTKDPNYSIRDLFGLTTAYEGTLPTLPTLPLDSLVPYFTTAESDNTGTGSNADTTADPSPEDTTPESVTDEVPSTEPDTSQETTPEETQPTATDESATTEPSAETEEPTSESPASADTTEGASSSEETTEATTPAETTAPPVVITDPTDINYHLKRYNMEESDLGKSTQLIVVQSTGTQCTLYFFEKSKEGWALAEAVPSAPGVLGRGGVSTSKHEGDGCTPAGYYALGPCYGKDAKSATEMEYHQITEGDYWIDDVSSKYYNTLVHEDNFAMRKGWQTGENMFDLLRYYQYMVVIQYNTDPIVPGAGSAIFLHCQAGDTDTSGCVSTKDATMFAIFRWLNPKADPHILIY